MLVAVGDRVVNRHDRRGAILSVLHPPQDFFLSVDSLCGGEQLPHIVLLSGNDLELAGGNTHLESWGNLDGGGLAPLRNASRKMSHSSVTISRSNLRSRVPCCEVSSPRSQRRGDLETASSDSGILSRPEFLSETHCFAKVVYETPCTERDLALQPSGLSVHSFSLRGIHERVTNEPPVGD